jgi:hypothetical protein
MAYPANITLKTVTGTFLNPDGTAFGPTLSAKAAVTFTPKYEKANLVFLRDATATPPTILVPSTIICYLNSSGAFAWSMPATDEPDLDPRGWQYEVGITMGEWSKALFRLSLPVAGPGTVDISTVIPL